VFLSCQIEPCFVISFLKLVRIGDGLSSPWGGVVALASCPWLAPTLDGLLPLTCPALDGLLPKETIGGSILCDRK
jgi:hypothetical protein